MMEKGPEISSKKSVQDGLTISEVSQCRARYDGEQGRTGYKGQRMLLRPRFGGPT